MQSQGRDFAGGGHEDDDDKGPIRAGKGGCPGRTSPHPPISILLQPPPAPGAKVLCLLHKFILAMSLMSDICCKAPCYLLMRDASKNKL